MTTDFGVPPSLGAESFAMDMAPIAPPRRVADSVHAMLREAIIEGRLVSGGRLSVPLLAQQLEVSRSPVREAVQRLVQEGLASEEPRRGAAVARLDPATLVPLYEIREALEGLAARLAAEHADDDELDMLRAAHDAHAAALERGDAVHHVALDMAFHAAIRAASHNDELHLYLERVQGKIAIAMLGGKPQLWSTKAILEHAAILDAILARDPDAAELAAKDHIRRVRGDIAALNPLPRPGVHSLR